MIYRTIRPFNFRNLKNIELDVNSSSVFLVGENGQGKTNFLESVYYLSYGVSFRNRNDKSLCKYGEKEFGLYSKISYNNDIPSSLGCSWKSGKKAVKLDGKNVTDRKSLVRLIPVILLYHDDFSFIIGSPKLQRFFFDQTMSLCDFLYIDVMRSYKQILRLRNGALANRDTTLIDVYNQQIAKVGIEIIKRRVSLIDQFSPLFSQLYRSISGSDSKISVGYYSSWGKSLRIEQIIGMLQDKRERDLATQTTTSGPHRDRFSFYFDDGDREFVKFASTGQIRLASIVLKITQMLLFTQETGSTPTVLVDDVLLELDPNRRARVFEYFPDCGQIFFTFLPGEKYGKYIKSTAIAYNVKDGQFEKI